VEAAGDHAAQSYEGWIAAGSFRGGVRLLITGPRGFERTVAFARDEASKRIVSAAARGLMAAAQRKGWAAARKDKGAAAVPAPAKGRREKAPPEPRARQ